MSMIFKYVLHFKVNPVAVSRTGKAIEDELEARQAVDDSVHFDLLHGVELLSSEIQLEDDKGITNKHQPPPSEVA